MKIELRQGVRAEIGELIRHKQAEKPVIPFVTGLLPSPVPAISTPTSPLSPETIAEQEQESIVQEVVACAQELIEHFPEARLLKLLDGLQTALTKTQPAYNNSAPKSARFPKVMRLGYFIPTISPVYRVPTMIVKTSSVSSID